MMPAGLFCYTQTTLWHHYVRVATVCPCSRFRSLHCVSCRSTSPQGWHPSAASSSPTCLSARHRWIHPARVPLRGQRRLLITVCSQSLLWRAFKMCTTCYTCIPALWPFACTIHHLQETATLTHHLHFRPPARISGPPLGPEWEDCSLHPALRGRLSSVDKLTDGDRIVCYPAANTNILSPPVQSCTRTSIVLSSIIVGLTSTISRSSVLSMHPLPSLSYILNVHLSLCSSLPLRTRFNAATYSRKSMVLSWKKI